MIAKASPPGHGVENIPLYNSRIICNYLEYLHNYHADTDADTVLREAGMTLSQIQDEGHWFTQEDVNRFHEILVARTGNSNISREAGRYAPSSRAAGALSKYALGFATPMAAYMVVKKFYSKGSKAVTLETRKIRANQVEIVATQNPGIRETHCQCENRRGIFEGIAKLFTGELAEVEHHACMHIDSDRCVYRIAWKETPAFVWKRIANYASLLLLLSIPLIFTFLPAGYRALPLLPMLLAVMGAFLYQAHLEKKELITTLEKQGEVASHLLDEINDRYNNTLLMREIGQATSTILDIDELLEYTMKTIEKRLDFDRGMIMLANKNKTHLVYQAGFGYQIDAAAESRQIEFHLDNPESKGVVVETFRRQQPCLVDDIRKVEESFSERSRGIARQMDVNAFICVPIVFEKESLGVLMVDNIKTKRPLKESDMSLLMGIAPQVAISIANATSFQRIRASEERFRALSENAPDIVYTLSVKGTISYVNPSWERILGYRNEEVIGRPLLDFLRKADAKMFIRTFQKIVDGRQRIVNLYGVILHRDGSEHMFNMSGVPNMDAEGHVIGVVGTFKDVTDLTKSEMELQVSYQKLKSVMSSTIDTISIIVESRDPYTAGHQRRVADLAVSIATELGFPEEKKDLIRMGSLIHDIGKIYIPAEILTRPVRLNDIEFSMMKAHTTVGYNILKKVEFIPAVVNMVYQHHERMDGSGYPKGIPGDQILMESRIIAVADTVEAMASHRPYRPSLGITAALDEIRLCRGSKYDTDVVDACLRLFEEKGFLFRQDEEAIHADR